MPIAQVTKAAKAAQRRSDFVELERTARELVERCTKAADMQQLGNAYAYLGAARIGQNDAPGARYAFERSREWLEEVDDSMGVVRALNGLAVTAMDIELDVASSRTYLEAALAIAQKSTGKERHWLGILLGNLGEVQRFEGAYEEAIVSAREALVILNKFDDAPRAAWQLVNIAHCRLLLHDVSAAVRSMEMAYNYLSRGATDPRMLAWYFDVWFIIAASERNWEIAARLLGFVNAFRAENKLVRLPLLSPWIAPMISRLNRALPNETAVLLTGEGSAFTLEQANALTSTSGRPLVRLKR